MKLKLLDVRTDEEFVRFGTCEMCFSTGTVDNPVFVFEKEDGTQFDDDTEFDSGWLMNLVGHYNYPE